MYYNTLSNTSAKSHSSFINPHHLPPPPFLTHPINATFSLPLLQVDFYESRAYWPGFRILRNRPINTKTPTKNDEKKSKKGWLQAFHQQKQKHVASMDNIDGQEGNNSNNNNNNESYSSSSTSTDASSLSVLEPGFYWRGE